jgi:phosphoribosylanthranilate isomerase
MFTTKSHPGIKICGIRSATQATEIIAAGADALGFNLWEKSKRYVSLPDLKSWLPDLRDDVFLVAVVVNPSVELLSEIVESKLFHAIQLHGDETPADVEQLMERNVEVIKALQVRDRTSLGQIADFPTANVLLDSYNPGLYGGAGESFPWELAVTARDLFPDKRIFLAGGLTPHNVRSAVNQVNPFAVDVASGVESTPGVKDIELVRHFIDEVSAAERA